jgi:protein TonB
MATLTFDNIPHSPRRKATRVVRRAPAQAVAIEFPISAPPQGKPRIGTLLLIGSIVALHGAAVVTLSSGARTVASTPVPVPITISLAPPKAIPPPPPPPKPETPPPRAKAAAPVRTAPAAPVAAPDTPVVAATSETVQVSRTPVDAAPEPALAPVVSEPVTEPRGYAGYLRNPAPDYPVAAQKRGLEGQVVLKVHVLASGQPDSVTVAKTSGHQILDEAALKAVTQWAFAPARRGQTAIDGWVQVPLNFKI